jgi:fibronectin type 3 domain-containing protein
LPPSNLRSEISEKRIRLSWEPPASEAKAETVFYNLYRTEREGVFLDRPRNDKPLAQPLFEDEDFSFGRTYYYAASSLIVEKGASRESENSLAVQVVPVDVYAPAVPTGLAVSAEKGVIKLYWFPNSEGDLGGYWIYRSEKEDGDFERIGMAGPAESTYVDLTTKPGIKYYYAVTAMDHATPPNESARSEVHGDRLPPSQPSSGDKPQSQP